MAKVDQGAYGSGNQRPKLTPEVLEGADLAVLTVKESHTGISTGDGRTAAFLVFKEFDEYAYWLNASGIRTLCNRISDDDDDWVGTKIPLIRVRVHNPSTNKKVEKYHVVDDEDWDDAIKASRRKRGGKEAKAKAKPKAKAK